jgi:hypothetical protein
LQGLSSQQLASLSTTQVRALTSAQVVALDGNDISLLSLAQVRAFSTAAILGLDSVNIQSMELSADRCTDQQPIDAAIESADLAAMTTAHIRQHGHGADLAPEHRHRPRPWKPPIWRC